MLDPRLHLSASPHLKAPDRTDVIMWTVTVTLAPAVLAAAYYFGLSAVLVLGTTIFGAVGTERVLGAPGTTRDGSAALTGLLLGLTLPPGIPLWVAFLGGVIAIGLGKIIFGGLGQNVFNPALIGRAFLQAAFPTLLTTWPEPGQGMTALVQSNLAFPFMSPTSDAITGATPLGLMKFEAVPTDLWSMMIGNTGGSLGETAGLLILLGGAYLAMRNYLDWRIPVGIFATVFACNGILNVIDPTSFPTVGFALFGGGLMLGAIYMATDMVTSPVTRKGAWIYAIGIGLLVVLIRTWGGLAEGVMYAILLMNAMVPFINRTTQPRVFGTAPSREVSA
jgi:H+/Na+-translocating ferredoxin:NAD+ oxidoreductase subunit D